MYTEIEVKLPIEDVSRLKAILERTAEPLERGIYETDIYFDHPCKDLASTDEVLRVRRTSTNRVELTYKGPKSSYEPKRRSEITTLVDDFEKIVEMLDVLNFRRIVEVKKRRSYYRLGQVLVSIDEVEGLGTFTELELVKPEGGLKALRDTAEKLGLGWAPIHRTYLDMILEKNG